MPAYKDKAKGTWYASFYFENWTGKKEKKMKRGFKTKREALEWERTFLQQQTADLDMTFESFVALYAADVKGRIKENTWGTKEHMFDPQYPKKLRKNLFFNPRYQYWNQAIVQNIAELDFSRHAACFDELYSNEGGKP